MLTAALRWAPGLLALFAIGPLVAVFVGSLKGFDGGQDASLLVGQSPLMGVVGMLVAFGAAAAVGLLTARLIGFRIATWAVGYTLAWAAFSATDVPSLFRAQPDAAGVPWIALAIEGVLCAALGLTLFTLLAWTARDHGGRPEGSAREAITAELVGKGPLAGVAAALIAGAIVTHLANMDPMKGQAVFAAFLGALAAGAAGSYVSAFVGSPARLPALAIGFGLLAVLGPIAGLVVHGGRGLEIANEGALLGPAAMIGLDWMAGLFMGLPAGVAMLESTVEQTTKAAA